MDQQKLIASIESRARAIEVPINDLCILAKVHPTTFSRWKESPRNPKPIGVTFKTLAKIEAALAEAEVRAGISSQAEAA